MLGSKQIEPRTKEIAQFADDRAVPVEEQPPPRIQADGNTHYSLLGLRLSAESLCMAEQ
ncbi:hypothetical protein [Mycobacterium lepromatosis]|uniref:hypothetical protein n=1 Tax=Mycobacterium lepromatosis TaxID=480418 RepID=UPI000AE86D5C|nr:hypothetical protein [Mycobacterium lepromatosis]